MTDYVERRVTVGTREVRYVEAGEGPTLVWLPGAGGVTPTAGTDALTEEFRVIAVELPGFGTSADDDSAQSFDELGAHAGRALEALGLSSYLLHGTSFGAAVGLHLALQHPERVERFVLESPSAFRQLGWTPPDVDQVRAGLFRHPEKVRGVGAPVNPAAALRQREYVNRLSLTVDRRALARRLRELHVPMRVIFGEFDTLTPPELAVMYCENAPDCTSVLIEDAAHAVSVDQPEAYAHAVRQFLLSGGTIAR